MEDEGGDEAAKVTLPALPPKGMKMKEISAKKTQERESWYFVKSPREQFGPMGPFELDQLRLIKKSGEIGESTLLWRPGQKAWQMLGTLPDLKTSLHILPPIPARNDDDNNVGNPLEELPNTGLIDKCQKLADINKYSNQRTCKCCGSLAISHIPGFGEQLPDLAMLRVPAGTTGDASEIISGFLWIGNSSTGRTKFIEQLKVNLIINCGANTKNPPSQAPSFRCRELALVEQKLEVDDATTTMEDLFDAFEKAYDIIEVARTSYERAIEADELPDEYRGPLDKYGRPIRTEEEQKRIRGGAKSKSNILQLEARILMWSRLGNDRPCTLVIAYLIQKWGMKLETALDYLIEKRRGTKISPLHMDALRKWSEKHTLGDYYCEDCISAGMIEDKNAEAGPGSKKVQQQSSLQNKTQQLIHAEIGKFPELTYIQNNVNIFFPTHLHSSSFEHLVDIILPACNIDSNKLRAISTCLATSNLLSQIRYIDFSNNMIDCDGMSCLCEEFRKCADVISPKTTSKVKSRHFMQLTHLFLQSNRIKSRGAIDIASLLESRFFIICLNVANNHLGDDGAFHISKALIAPEKDIFAEENPADYGTSTDTIDPHALPESVTFGKLYGNCTVTDLDMSNTGLGMESILALTEVMKTNFSIVNLRLDNCENVRSSEINNFCNTARVFNRSLKKIFFDDTKLQVNTFDSVTRMMIEPTPLPLHTLSCARCDLTHLHIKRSIFRIGTSKLTHLILSGNIIGDIGASALCGAIRGENSGLEIESKNNFGFLLKYLDISSCGIGIQGAIEVFSALAIKANSLKYVDISDNNLFSEIILYEQLSSAIDKMKCQVLNMNRCRLGSDGCIELFKVLQHTSAEHCGNTLKSLLLSGNEIHDRFEPAFQLFLQNNHLIELIDISFNEITDNGLIYASQVLRVNSSSPLIRKLNELHINVIGNKCNPYAMEYPGMARSKSTLRYGNHQTSNAALTYIPQSARSHFKERLLIDNKLDYENPTPKINFVS